MGKIWSAQLKNDLLPNTRAVVAWLKAVTETTPTKAGRVENEVKNKRCKISCKLSRPVEVFQEKKEGERGSLFVQTQTSTFCVEEIGRPLNRGCLPAGLVCQLQLCNNKPDLLLLSTIIKDRFYCGMMQQRTFVSHSTFAQKDLNIEHINLGILKLNSQIGLFGENCESRSC